MPHCVYCASAGQYFLSMPSETDVWKVSSAVAQGLLGGGRGVVGMCVEGGGEGRMAQGGMGQRGLRQGARHKTGIHVHVHVG